jgi:hypothetical protein
MAKIKFRPDQSAFGDQSLRVTFVATRRRAPRFKQGAWLACLASWLDLHRGTRGGWLRHRRARAGGGDRQSRVRIVSFGFLLNSGKVHLGVSIPDDSGP